MIPDHVKHWQATRTIALGVAALIVLIGGAAVWGVSTKIAGAVVASGLVQVQNRSQVIEHPTGGVVGDLRVVDGDTVAAGDVVVRFDSTQVSSSLAIIDAQYIEVQVRIARLRAERDDLGEISIPDRLLARAAHSPEIRDQIDGQTRLFAARMNTAEQRKNQLSEQKRQTENAILGLEFQRDALTSQLGLLDAEFADQRTLLDRGLTQAARVSGIEREIAQMRGQIGRRTKL
jgi:HlyD family secretion protein